MRAGLAAAPLTQQAAASWITRQRLQLSLRPARHWLECGKLVAVLDPQMRLLAPWPRVFVEWLAKCIAGELLSPSQMQMGALLYRCFAVHNGCMASTAFSEI